MEIFILIGLFFLNGLFAMSEIAVVTAKKSRLMTLADQGSRRAKAAAKLAEDPTQFLSTVQIGITSVGILSGIYGESVLAEPFAEWLQTVGLSQPVAIPLATVLVVVVVTYLAIVIGELVPKRIGQINAERIACLVARPMELLATAAKPFVMLLSGSTQLLLRLLGFKPNSHQNVTEEDIQALLLEGSASGVIEQHEHRMVRNVFRFDERPVTSLMVPRGDIIFLDVALSAEENYRRMTDSPHSGFPVCEHQFDNLIGVVNAKEMLVHVLTGSALDLNNLAKPGYFVPPGVTALELLNYFQTSDTRMAFIVDEYGGLKGLVTLQDLTEALTGEFLSEEDEDAFVIQRKDGSLLLDGLLPAIDLKDILALASLPDDGKYQTLNGLIMQVMEKLPATGDWIELGPWRLEIVDMDGRRVDKVLATKLDEESVNAG